MKTPAFFVSRAVSVPQTVLQPAHFVLMNPNTPLPMPDCQCAFFLGAIISSTFAAGIISLSTWRIVLAPKLGQNVFHIAAAASTALGVDASRAVRA